MRSRAPSNRRRHAGVNGIGRERATGPTSGIASLSTTLVLAIFSLLTNAHSVVAFFTDSYDIEELQRPTDRFAELLRQIDENEQRR